ADFLLHFLRCDRKRRSNGALAGTAFLGDKRNRPHVFPSQHTSCAQAAAGIEGSSQGTLSNCGRCVNKALAKRRFAKKLAQFQTGGGVGSPETNESQSPSRGVNPLGFPSAASVIFSIRISAFFRSSSQRLFSASPRS